MYTGSRKHIGSATTQMRYAKKTWRLFRKTVEMVTAGKPRLQNAESHYKVVSSFLKSPWQYFGCYFWAYSCWDRDSKVWFCFSVFYLQPIYLFSYNEIGTNLFQRWPVSFILWACYISAVLMRPSKLYTVTWKMSLILWKGWGWF